MSEYSGYDIKQLWRMVEAARQGLQPSHDQVAALSKAQQMLSVHAQSLETARDQLTTIWPPKTNAASAAYLAELDRLIVAVKDTALSCAINVFHINAVSDAIVQAHETLKPLHKEYVRNEGILAQYEAEINAFGEAGSAIPGSSTIAKGTAKLFTSPPVDDSRQDELTKQAQQAMVPLSGAALDGAAYIKPPALYTPPTVDGNPVTENPYHFGSSGSDSGSGGAVRPPVIDPPASSRTRGNISDTTQVDGGVATTPQPAQNSGPVLSDYTPAPVSSTPSLVPPVGSGHGTRSPAGPIPALIPGIGGPASKSGIPAGGYGVRPPASLAPGASGLSRGSFGDAAAPRNGVIGNVPVGKDALRSTPARANLSEAPEAATFGSQTGGRGRRTGEVGKR